MDVVLIGSCISRILCSSDCSRAEDDRIVELGDQVFGKIDSTDVEVPNQEESIDGERCYLLEDGLKVVGMLGSGVSPSPADVGQAGSGRAAISRAFYSDLPYDMAINPAIPVAPYATSDKTSFAHISAKDRWPVIVVRHSLLLIQVRLTIQDRSH